MSIKQQLARTVEELPESVTLDEAIERIYRAFKLKQAMGRSQRSADDQLAPEEQQRAWRNWAERGPQGPIAEEEDAEWP